MSGLHYAAIAHSGMFNFNYLKHHENGIFTPCGQEIVGFLLPSLVQDEQTENFPYRLSRNYVKIFLVIADLLRLVTLFSPLKEYFNANFRIIIINLITCHVGLCYYFSETA